MQRIDRVVGSALALLALAVLWSARTFPVVPGQKVGAGFLPMLIGAGLLACGAALVWRSLRVAARDGSASPGDEAARPAEHFSSAAVIVAVVVAYLLLAERLGFLLVAPVALLAMFRALQVAWVPSFAWAIGGTVIVHLAFYKLLRVPLPWGLLRPFY
ncbi:MAG: tripartite tricarboxylate transporter TctB family protein [Rubrivivax sp.]|nr:tripartite tricarboxylate transporter TctB family protein [Rubrivivax sp.]